MVYFYYKLVFFKFVGGISNKIYEWRWDFDGSYVNSI